MTAALSQIPDGLEITGNITAEYSNIFTPEALAFVEMLSRKFSTRVDGLLEERKKLQKELLAGKKLDFLPETESIRDGDWKVAPIPEDLQDRRVEITGPVNRKMIINAMNSGAKVFMADFEDSLTPSWDNIAQGQINLADAVNKTISYDSPASAGQQSKHYSLNEETAVLIIRPRGWHLKEKHIFIDDESVYGAFVDFGLYFFHNAKTLLANGSGPYFYLPKLETWQEAALWNDIFIAAQEALGLPIGTIKATVLIETITAAFQMDEILHALKDHIVAQNAGRWDYIFSYIKKHSHNPDFICPDRGQVIMTQPFLRAYSLLLIKTCHKRGAFAMGGMSAFIPIKNDEEANNAAIAAVTADKEREASDGHDGTWVAHPGLISIARAAFDRLMPTPNQVDRLRDDVDVTADDLLETPTGSITDAGLRNNISVSLQYLESWLRGNGCVPIFNLMEDAATAEIARTQIWQWINHNSSLEDGTQITKELFSQYRGEELSKISNAIGHNAFNAGKFAEASDLLEKIVLNSEFEEFLTLRAYSDVS